eukprot:6078185-Pleurochrysis_carterae.AAC.1
MGAAIGQTAVGERDPRRACLLRHPAVPRCVPMPSHFGPHRHPGQRPTGSEPPWVPLSRQPSYLSMVGLAQCALSQEIQPQAPNVQLQTHHHESFVGLPH